jgi:hypothetical protein
VNVSGRDFDAGLRRIGNNAYLNNTTATGLAILDTSVSPNNAIIGVSNSTAGYIVTETLPKQLQRS